MYCTKCGKDIGADAIFCQYCGVRQTGAPVYTAAPARRLMRSRYDKKVAGVCAGVARYFDIDTNLVRLVWLLCFLLGGTGFIAYIVCWIVMPMEPAYLEATTYTQSAPKSA